MLEFKQTSKNEFMVDGVKIEEMILGLVDDFDNSIPFEKSISHTLINSMISRYVTARFIKGREGLIDKEGFILIIIKLSDRSIKATIGGVNVNEKQIYLNGVLYD